MSGLVSKVVLVTGGAGFIGSHLSAELLRRGYGVRVLDNLSQGRQEWVPSGADFVEGDVADLATCRRACAGVSAVFHAAAMSRVAPSIGASERCTRDNIVGTENVLLAAREAGVAKVVFSGSSTYYGSQKPPHTEDLPPQCLNFYALSKYVGEQYCLLFDRSFDLPTVVLRYFNVYGPRQPETGAYALVLGIFLRQWRAGQPLTIHGDGAQRRDFVHVRDVVAANVRALESAVRGAVFNVGSGTSVSVRELADMISPRQVFAPRRAADADATLADIRAIRDGLGWAPAVAFGDGLRELMARGEA